MKWVKNIKILSKMLILSAVVIIGLLSIGGIGFSQLTKLGDSLKNMYEGKLSPIESLSSINSNQQHIQAAVLELMINEEDSRNMELVNEIDERTKQNRQLRENFNTDSAEESKLLKQLDELTEEYHNRVGNIMSLARDNKKGIAYTSYLNNLEPTANELNEVINQLISFNSKDAKDVNEHNKKDINVSIMLLISIIVVVLLVYFVISWFIINSIIKPLKEIEIKMSDAKNGDLTVQSNYVSKDEIGSLSESFNEMVVQIKDLIMKVRESSDLVAASSEELLASAEQTSSATEHIAEASTELAVGSENSVKGAESASISMGNMAMGIAQIRDSIGNVTVHSNVTSEESEKGNQAITKTIEQMGTINESVMFSSDVIKDLGARSEEIEKIVGVISGISEQTNLLALNAAIEAARAGEHGKGFAVVADEVRKLAEESRKSAEQITNLIRNIQQNTNNAVSSMEKCTDEVQTGLVLVNNTGESFQRILNSALDVSKQVEEVSQSIDQISTDVENMAMSVAEVSINAETAAQNSQNVAAGAEEQLASMEEITASANSLAHMADDLRKMVTFFKLNSTEQPTSEEVIVVEENSTEE